MQQHSTQIAGSVCRLSSIRSKPETNVAVSFIVNTPCLQVYVMGCSIAVVHRPSLQVPPEDADVTAQRVGIQIMSRVSAFDSTSPMGCEAVEGPPDWFLDQLAATLRNRLQLQLFNFDLVRPAKHNAPGMHLVTVPIGVQMYIVMYIMYNSCTVTWSSSCHQLCSMPDHVKSPASCISASWPLRTGLACQIL